MIQSGRFIPFSATLKMPAGGLARSPSVDSGHDLAFGHAASSVGSVRSEIGTLLLELLVIRNLKDCRPCFALALYPIGIT